MDTVDYIYRFDPRSSLVKVDPPTAEEARRKLISGNQLFSAWMASARNRDMSTGEPRYVVHCSPQEVGMVQADGEIPRQAPFAVVVGCSDARVPIEMIFGQGFNDLFVVRVAGNVLDDACVGSIDFALHALAQSVKIVVLMGHTGCGAVSAAVDAYLHPMSYWSGAVTPALRTVLQALYVPVNEAATVLHEVWGPNASRRPYYREALWELGVWLNTVQSAYDLNLKVRLSGRPEIEVVYGIYHLHNQRVAAPADFGGTINHEQIQLCYAPDRPRVFREIVRPLAIELAERLEAKLDPLAQRKPEDRPPQNGTPGKAPSRRKRRSQGDAAGG